MRAAGATWSRGDVILGLYEVLGVAGRGGMGVVYRVHHREWGVDLAVKSPLHDAADVQALEREAETWMDLGLHPHVCTCHYVRRIDDGPRVFAEFVEGGSLADRIADGSVYERGGEPLLDVAIGVADGLAHAHERGVVHQDVKPRNILLDVDGAAKVTDFGIARAGMRIGTSVTDPQVSMGGMTPAYRSPEQAAGARLTGATDVWSFAVSVLELYMGHLPGPEGQAAPHVLDAFLRRGNPDPAIPRLPTAAAALLGDGLARDPAARPSMAEVAHRLREIYAQEFGTSHPRDMAADATLLAGELSNRALSMLDLGRPKAAERLWAEALRQDPQHPEATYNQGLHLWRGAAIADDELLRRLRSANDATLLAHAESERGDVWAAEALVHKVDERLAASEVTAVAIGRDDHWAVTGSTGGRVWVWDLGSGRLAGRLEGHLNHIRAIALTSDGRLALTAGADHRLCVFDLATRALIGEWRHPRGVTGVAVGHDGRRTVTGCSDGLVRVWDTVSGRLLLSIGEERPASSVADQAVALSADGRLVLAASRPALSLGADAPALAWLASTVDGEVIRTVEHGAAVNDVALTPDGRLALTGGADRVSRLWDLSTGRCAAVLEGHLDRVLSVSISPAGDLALTGGADRTARLWDLSSGRCLRTIGGHTDAVQAVALTLDGRRALTGSADGTARLSEFRPGRHAAFAYARPRPALDAARADARIRAELARVDDLIARREVRAAAHRLRALRDMPGQARHPAILARWRAAGRSGRRTRLTAAWTARALGGHAGRIEAVAVTPDGRLAVTGSADATMRVWDVGDGRCLRVVEGHADAVTAVAVSATGDRALTGSDDETARVWDLRSGRCEWVLPSGGFVRSVAISPDGRIGATGAMDRTLRVWDLHTGSVLRTMRAAGQVNAVAMTPDTRWVLAGCGFVIGVDAPDGFGQLWGIERARCARTVGVPNKNIAGVALTTDARLALTADGWDETARVWDLRTSRPVHTLAGHSRCVTSAALTADGRFGLTGGWDGARLWDMSDGRCLHDFSDDAGRVEAVALTPDGARALTAGQDRTVRVWELDWEFEYPPAADPDAAARPYLEALLRARAPWAAPLSPDGPLRNGVPVFNAEDLHRELQDSGLGWLRFEGVRAEVERMIAAWPL